jgi:hypothetical protein
MRKDTLPHIVQAQVEKYGNNMRQFNNEVQHLGKRKGK